MSVLPYTEGARGYKIYLSEGLSILYIKREVYQGEADSCRDCLQELFHALVSSTLHRVPTATYKGGDNNGVGKIPTKAILRAGS